MDLVRRLVVFFVISTSLLAQEYIIKKYSMRDGMPTNQVTAIEQDVEGRIWFASQIGLFSYDGHEWVLRDTDIEKPCEFHRLKKDKLGRLWALPMNLSFPITYYENEEWKSIGTPLPNSIDLESGSFDVVAEEGRTQVLLSVNYNRLKYYNGDDWFDVKIPAELQISDIHSIVEFRNVFYLATNQGVASFDGEEISLVSEINKQLIKPEIFFIARTGLTDDLYMLGANSLQIYKDGQVEVVSENLPFQRHYIIGRNNLWLKYDDNGTVYFGNETGIYYIANNSNRIENLDYDKKSRRPGTLTFLIDRDRNIWLSDMREVVKLRFSPFKNFNSENILPSDEVSAIEVLTNGDVLLGQYGSITRISGRDHEILEFDDYTTEGISIARVMDLLESKNGDIWVTAFNKGVGRINNNRVDWIFRPEDDAFNTLVEFKDEVLLGTNSGIYELNKNNVSRKYPEISGYIRTLQVLGENKLGVCSGQRGIYIITDEGIVNYSSDLVNVNSTYSVHEKNGLGILVGSRAGLFLVDGNTLTKYTKGDFSIDSPVYFITEDRSNGDLWFGLDNGVVKWDGNSLWCYTESDGLLGTETNRAAGVFDKEGNFWIGTNRGAAKYEKGYDLNSEVSPIGKILDLETGKGSSFSPGDKVELDYDDNNITINYRAFSYTNEDLNQYRTILKNDNNEIIDSFITKEESIRYSSLSPGKYTFYLKIINPNEVASKEFYSLSFTINKAFYRETWFLIIFTLALTVIFWFLFEYVNQKKYAERLKNDVADRTEELSEKVIELEEVETALRKSEEQFRNVFLNSDIGMFQSYIEGGFKLINPALVKILGYSSAEEVKNLDIAEDTYVEPIDREEFIELLKKEKKITNHQRKLKHKSGRVIYTNEMARLFTDDDGREIIEGTIEDVTEKVLAQKAIVEAKEKAEKSDKLKSQFLAQMSHEIRTPINSILNFSTLLREDLRGKVEEDLEIGFSIMQNAGRRIMRTIDLLLNMSELQTGTYEMNSRQLNIRGELLDSLYLEFKVVAREKNLVMKLLDETESKAVVFADEYTLGQIFNNLLDNAIKYTDEGGINIHLQYDDKGRLKVEISDTGIGMSEDYIPSLFNPFTQEEEGYTRKYEGNGLGLALVKQYCELNEIDISVKSKKRHGTTFTLVFNHQV